MKVLNHRYELTRRIAVGGMGEVWAATDTVLHREVAVKILRDDLADSEVFLERFRAEARHTAALSHPGIAKVFDYGEDLQDGLRLAYLVMELVPGRPLSKVMAEQGAVPLNTVLSLLAQTAEALHAAHTSGVIHRDVKPGNLLLLDDGTIKVTDFGIARATNAVSITEVGQVIGTARYMSPEQASGAEATPSSDVYSLGVIGYEMIAGHALFAAENAGALAMAHVHQPPPPLPLTVPHGVRDLIAEALSKNPADRPDDAQAFAVKIRRLQLSSMPAPSQSVAAPVQGDESTVLATASTLAPTQTMSPLGDGSKTAIMPVGGIIAATPSLLGPSRRRSPRIRRRRITLIALAAVIVVIAITELGTAGGQLPIVATAPSATQLVISSATIDSRTLIGRNSTDVAAALSRAGYHVATEIVSAPGLAKGLVTAVRPVGVVELGATVTLSVSAGTPAATTTSIPRTTTTITAVTAVTTITVRPGKGHGKGKH